MKEKKVTSYLAYAIGEILLVVVGILIAVSIDDWNERKKELAQEQAIIKSLKLEFEENLTALRVDMDRLQVVIKTCEYLYKITGPSYANGSENVDSLLTKTFSFPTWSPSNFILNDIKSSGLLSSMSDSTLKSLLLDWERFYDNLEDWHSFYETRSNKYFDYVVENGNSKNINGYTKELPYRMKSSFNRSNEELMKQISFENNLSDKLIISKFIEGWYNQTIPKLELIISACNQATQEK